MAEQVWESSLERRKRSEWPWCYVGYPRRISHRRCAVQVTKFHRCVVKKKKSQLVLILTMTTEYKIYANGF